MWIVILVIIIAVVIVMASFVRAKAKREERQEAAERQIYAKYYEQGQGNKHDYARLMVALSYVIGDEGLERDYDKGCAGLYELLYSEQSDIRITARREYANQVSQNMLEIQLRSHPNKDD